MITALYVRVSSEEQAKEGHSIENQTARLKAYSEFQGWTNIEIFIDEGKSAKDMDRPSMQRLVKLIKQGQIERVVTLSLDRLSRRVFDILNFINLLDKHGAAYVSVTQSFDTSTAIGRLMLNILATVAEFERELIAERIKSNLMGIVERQGRYVGGEPPFGYEYIDKRLSVSPSESSHVLRMAEWFANGKGYRDIARRMNESGIATRKNKLWSPQTVKQLLRNEVYMGKLIYNRSKAKSPDEWIVVEDAHPAIFDDDIWASIQARLEEIPTQPGISQLKYRASGLMVCGHCGAKMHSNTYRVRNKYTYETFVCSGYKQGKGCKHRYVMVDVVDKFVHEWLQSASKGMVPIPQEVLSEQKKARQNDAERRLRLIDMKFQRQIEAYENDLISAHDLKLARERVEQERLSLLSQPIEPPLDIERLAKHALALWDDYKATQHALRALIDHIAITDGEVIIVLGSVM